MSFRDVERMIWKEAEKVFCNPKLKLKDIREWSSDEDAVKRNLESDEVMAKISSGVWVAVLKVNDNRTN